MIPEDFCHRSSGNVHAYPYTGSLHPVHSFKEAGKGYPSINKFHSDKNTIFIALIVLENNDQSSTWSCSWYICSDALSWLHVCDNRVMHCAITQSGAHHKHNIALYKSEVLLVLLLLWAWHSHLNEMLTCLFTAKICVSKSEGRIEQAFTCIYGQDVGGFGGVIDAGNQHSLSWACSLVLKTLSTTWTNTKRARKTKFFSYPRFIYLFIFLYRLIRYLFTYWTLCYQLKHLIQARHTLQSQILALKWGNVENRDMTFKGILWDIFWRAPST